MYMPQELTYELEAPTKPLENPFSRPVSPAILQQRIIDLGKELQDEKNKRAKAETELMILKQRIEGFEGIVKCIAHKADELYQSLEKISKDKFPNLRPAA